MPHSEPVAALSAATNWRKASYSEGDQNGCVEVGTVSGFVGVRDTKLGAASAILAFADSEWAAFLAGVRNHEFDR